MASELPFPDAMPVPSEPKYAGWPVDQWCVRCMIRIRDGAHDLIVPYDRIRIIFMHGKTTMEEHEWLGRQIIKYSRRGEGRAGVQGGQS